MNGKTGFIFHELYLWHTTGFAALEVPPSLTVQPDLHIENPEGKRRVRNLLDVSGVLEQLIAIKPVAAPIQAIERVHASDYIQKIAKQSQAGHGNAGTDVPFGSGSYEIALLSAGGAITAVDAVMNDRVENVYALVRPPGHHAEYDIGKGFCIFNNGTVAIRHAQDKYQAKKIAIIDWDVHHGNGTQSLLYQDDSVLTISIHQDGCYPLTGGLIEERGNDGKSNVNLPLPAGSGHGAYLETFEKIVMPLVDQFAPELIFVSCGLDASAVDPLARQMCTSETYAQMTKFTMDLAKRHCQNRVIFLHEGGYSPQYVPYCALRIIEELSGFKSPNIDDPFLDDLMRMAGQKLQPHQQSLIESWIDFFGCSK